MSIFNPLYAESHDASPPVTESTSSLMNDVVGVCPKCKQPFGTGLVGGDEVYYCDSCRVSQPIPR